MNILKVFELKLMILGVASDFKLIHVIFAKDGNCIFWKCSIMYNCSLFYNVCA